MRPLRPMSWAILLAACGPALAIPMKKHMMRKKGLAGMGAVCIDGTDAGFYFAPATVASAAKSWQLYFEGGGWCYDELDCWGRAHSNLGSSKKWPKTMLSGGLMSDDCKLNPDFCNVNRVVFKYCDGNSFSGNRDEPVKVTGPDGVALPLYFRGKRIIDAVLDTLLEKMGLAEAEEVLLTGCSAGGLATYLHADYVHDRLKQAVPGLKKMRAAPISGMFLLHKSAEGKAVYPEEIKNIFHLANSTRGVNQRCIAAKPEHDHWMCNFAEISYRYTETPIFVLNSALDSWQVKCIWAAALLPGFPNQTGTANGHCDALKPWKKCTSSPERCGDEQIDDLNQYMTDFGHVMDGTETYSKEGNGAFVVSCYEHCEANYDSWNKFVIDGLTIQQAFSAWWKSDGSEPAKKHTYSDCQYRRNMTPHMCNPTCSKSSLTSYPALWSVDDDMPLLQV